MAGDASPGNRQSVRVCCRFRPMNKLERAHGTDKCVEVSPDGKRVDVYSGGDTKQSQVSQASFTYDMVFPDNSTQEQVYEFTSKPQVQEALNGYNCTIFAYGQTGSGKTHTMMGPEGGELIDDRNGRGIIPRIASDIFVAMMESGEAIEFTVKVSFVEIYMERIRDLLNSKSSSSQRGSLKIREDRQRGITVQGAVEEYISCPEEMLAIMKRGSACRAIASTRMNQDSSRSHSVFMITISQKNTETNVLKTGKLTLVDLAGSEMIKKTGATSTVLEEAKMINKSLSALGNVIKALVQGGAHIPYRDSKLTRLLQDSLGGNSKTSLIITASCSPYNVTETLSTLRFGTRAKQIKNKPTVNQELSISQYKSIVSSREQAIAKLREYIVALEKQVGIAGTASEVLGTDVMGDPATNSSSATANVHATASPGTDAKPPRTNRTGDARQRAWPSANEQATAPSERTALSASGSQGAGDGPRRKFSEGAEITVDTGTNQARVEDVLVASTMNETKADEPRSDLLERAEMALTVALETTDQLEQQLEDSKSELQVTAIALEGQRTLVSELQGKLVTEELNVERLSTENNVLTMQNEKFKFDLHETQLTCETLRNENSMYLEQIRLNASPRRRSESAMTSSSLVSRSNSLISTHGEFPSAELTDEEEETASVGEGDGHAGGESVCLAGSGGDRTAQGQGAVESRGGGGTDALVGQVGGDEHGGGRSVATGDTAQARREQLLENDLRVITDKYVQLRLELVDWQDKYDTIKNSKKKQLYNDAMEIRLKYEQSQRQYQVVCTQLQVSQQREKMADLKMNNREQHIEYLEEIIQDYQTGFKEKVEEYQKHVMELETELARYKTVFDKLEKEDFDDSSNRVDKHAHMPKVVKPIRGGSTVEPPSSDDMVSSEDESDDWKNLASGV